MGRPRAFDRDKALRKATKVFWKQGYVNTSVADLKKAMGLGEGSFYNAFKSKRALYLECLKHYNQTFMARRSEALRAEGSAKDRIHGFFQVVIDDLARNKAAGCLVSNSLTHEVLSERELKRYLFGGFESFLEYVADIVKQGQESGEIHASLDPTAQARVLFTYLHGLHRLSAYEFDAESRSAETIAFVNAVLPGD